MDLVDIQLSQVDVQPCVTQLLTGGLDALQKSGTHSMQAHCMRVYRTPVTAGQLRSSEAITVSTAQCGCALLSLMTLVI